MHVARQNGGGADHDELIGFHLEQAQANRRERPGRRRPADRPERGAPRDRRSTLFTSTAGGSATALGRSRWPKVTLCHIRGK
jgi:hypothetical protein